jgi:aspartate/methionine/tyrosine aminotransferase
MKLPPFLLDQWLAAHEFAEPPIRFNLASSTGPQWTLAELLALGAGEAALQEIAALKLSYVPPQGGGKLRERIAARHGVSPEEVVVTTGASEALQALICHLAPGASGSRASILLPKPCYPAIPALARAWGLEVFEYVLESPAFEQRADRILSCVDDSTCAVFVNTPHNPTGSVMSAAEQRKLADALAQRNVPLVVDEVYHPLYFAGEVPSAAALANTIVLGDFAKAMSLPGLRIGWLIDRDAGRRAALVDARSYFTISGSPLTEAIGALALTNADAVLGRLRGLASTNLALLDAFMDRHREQIEYTRPAGGTTCFPRLRDGRNARPLCEALAKAGVLVAPGDCFDLPAHMRIGFGAQTRGYADALDIFTAVLARF